MQRKRQRDYYSTGTVELGSTLMSVAPMRKLSMKRVIKWIIVIIILYVIYSIYQKTQLASGKVEDYAAIYGIKDHQSENRNEREDVIEEIVEKRVKQHINEVFEDLKRQEEEKERLEEERDVFEDYRVNMEENLKPANNEIEQADDIKEEIGDDDEIFGVNEANNNPDENIEDDFEPVDEKKEKEDIELEKEIEELLADAFKEAEEEAKVEVKKVEEMDIVEKPDIPVVHDEQAENIRVEADDLRLQKERARIAYQHQKQFDVAVQQMGKKLRPMEIKRLNDLSAKKAQENDDDHEFPPFVTAVRQTTIDQVTQLVASIQQHLPGRKVYVYDLDLTKEQKKELMSYCGVRVRLFMGSLFPKYVRNLDNLHWKPLVMQTALSEFGHITWINPNYRLGTHEVAPLVHESHEQGILVVGQKTSYSTFSATHPDMLKFISTDVDKLKNNPHIEIRAIMMHNTDEVHEKIMKVLTACALEQSCIAPEGAKWKCRFDFTGRKYADCHRYDESALNILLKNWFNYDMNQFARGNNYFRAYDPSYRPKLKRCRDPKDIRDSEL